MFGTGVPLRDGYYINTVGQYGNLNMITNYVKRQGLKSYTQIHHENLSLFDDEGSGSH